MAGQQVQQPPGTLQNWPRSLDAPSPLIEVPIRNMLMHLWLAYGQSKTANILFVVEATRRWACDGTTANALHPGAMMTNLQRHITAEQLAALRSGSGGQPLKNVERGAATSAFVATSALLEGIGGRYFEVSNQAVRHVEGIATGVADYALDTTTAGALWETSTRLIKDAS